jgi:hypothetical protein
MIVASGRLRDSSLSRQDLIFWNRERQIVKEELGRQLFRSQS